MHPGRETGAPTDASRATIDAPAHPLPAVRQGKVDYDQYLQSPTSKFNIFSAEQDRRRRRSVVATVAAVTLTIVVLWILISHL